MNAPSTYPSAVPLLVILVSAASVLLIGISSRRPNLREFWTLLAAGAKFALVLSLLPSVLANQVAETRLFQISPGIELTLRADAFGVFFALIASSLWILTSFYSIGYVRGLKEEHQTRYFASFALCLSATLGVAFAANLLTFVIFYEVLTIATYPLVIHKETPEAIRAGRKYLAFTLTAGVVLVAATAATLQLTGTSDFQPGGLRAFETLSPTAVKVLFGMFLLGVGVKAAIMPLHAWLPSAMVAPTPVSALLHAVAVVKSGVFGVVRVVGFLFGPEMLARFGLNEVLLWLAGSTILLASCLAFAEDHLKRRLAYSTIGHLSYVVLGAALLSPSGLIGGLLHIANHATMKIVLFFCAGAIYVNARKERISELDGIGRAMPWTMGAFAVASLGLAGLPPVSGFVSKWYLGLGALEGGSGAALIILLISGLLNAGYFMPIVYRAFFKQSVNFKSIGEASLWMVVPLVLAACLSVLLGLKPDLIFHFFPLAQRIAAQVLETSLQ